MIRLCKGCEPQILVENRTAWTAEYVDWLKDSEGNEPRRYADPDIRAALEAETYSKCAYCEGRFKPTSYGHIEHKLPKRKYPKLVCVWTNLTVACQVCNTNKGDYDDPTCRLLDPHVDDVEELVVFAGPMAFTRNDSRTHATIKCLQLNRDGLFFQRKQILERLNSILDTVQRACNEPAVVRALWFDIDSLTAADGEYASACRQFLKSELRERGIAKPAPCH